MGKKYLDTKEGSLEQSVLGVWETAIEEKNERVDGRTKQYREHRKKLESARQRREEKKKSVNEEQGFSDEELEEMSDDEDEVYEASGDKEAYQKFFQKALKKFGVKSPAELKGDKEKEFYDYVDKNWKGDHEEETQKESIDWTNSYNREWGTDELRKHTEEVTPGQNGEWAEAVNAKNQTMREALAKVWSVDEGKSPFKKENKKDGKTLTGKKVASVDINPTIKEKAK
jgi:hypothetical protein